MRWLAAIALLAILGSRPAAHATAQRSLSAPGDGVVRALVVGIDRYGHVIPLKGADADANDIFDTLKRMKAKDVTLLIDGKANRDALLHELDGLVARTQAGDLVILTVAGHGAKEPSRDRGSSSPDGNDEVFLLADFDPKSPTGATQKILNHEFKHYLRALEARGAQVVFIADTCFGGGLAREITPGVAMSYRHVPRYRLVTNDFKPVSTAADVQQSDGDLQKTIFLAAVDSDTKAPEVVIGGAYRGALSYAVARAFEGAAADGADGRVTTRGLLNYVRRVVYQLSDERQNIAAPISAKRDIDSEVILKLKIPGDQAKPAMAPPAEGTPSMPHLRLATTSRRHDALNGARPLHTPFDIVGPDDDADVVWDAAASEAIVAGDKVALGVKREDIGGVVDRTAAVRDIKLMVTRSPQAMRVLPDASLHHEGNRVDVELTDLADRSLVLIDLAGSGMLRVIYPSAHSKPVSGRDVFRVPLVVRDPYGADEVVAVSSSQKLDDLMLALRDVDGRMDAGLLPALIAQHLPAGSRVGLVGVFTVP